MAWTVASDDAVRAERFLSAAAETERGPLAAVLLRDAEAVLELPSIHTIQRYPFALVAGALPPLFHGRYDRAEQLCAAGTRRGGRAQRRARRRGRVGTCHGRPVTDRRPRRGDRAPGAGVALLSPLRPARITSYACSTSLPTFRCASGDLVMAADNAARGPRPRSPNRQPGPDQRRARRARLRPRRRRTGTEPRVDRREPRTHRAGSAPSSSTNKRFS